MAGKISPFAPSQRPELPAIRGVRLAAAEAQIRYRGRPDVMLALLDPGTAIAGVFTRSLTRSAPVEWCAQNIGKSPARAIIANAGNSNAFTGKAGIASVKAVAGAVAKAIESKASEVYVASTGVIGEPLDPGPIVKVVPQLVANARPDRWNEAAEAILTTDTFAKMVSVQSRYGGKTVTINGFAKGSGMIAPDMATMLAFMFTDADVPARLLQPLLKDATAETFNCITVDGDTSTSDTVLLAATGQAGPAPAGLRSQHDPRLRGFKEALGNAAKELALLVVKDGEGAEKLITVTVVGAATGAEARMIGMSIANSPLVKTAIAGEDANWGRVVMAVGKSGARANRDRLKIWLGETRVANNGARDPEYREDQVVAHMKGRYIHIKVDAGVGHEKATVWSTDLTHRYIDINGSYRT
ncbi:MAG TPA: bifunctional glutamate N-acetyltransferase/amino-acid acetyltransferase ArgJ [Aestuariivirgaceae bacterium]|jgi:glutamate N-acetyltransferase/amino-acid N-acetyltransferase